MNALALTFQDIHFDVVDRSGQPWLRLHQIGGALGYSRADSINKLYQSNAAEFTPSMTALVELDTAGGRQLVRIFSLRGCHLLAMFARTPVAAAFRRWVLDILDRHAEPEWPVIEGGGLPRGLRILLRHDGGGRFSARVLDRPGLQAAGLLPPLLDAWAARFPHQGRRGEGVTAGEAIRAVEADPAAPENAALHAALTAVCGDAFGLNVRRLGNYLARTGSLAEGSRFESIGFKQNACVWRVTH